MIHHSDTWAVDSYSLGNSSNLIQPTQAVRPQEPPCSPHVKQCWQYHILVETQAQMDWEPSMRSTDLGLHLRL